MTCWMAAPHGIRSGADSDTLNGGAGVGVFIFTRFADSSAVLPEADRIVNFQSGVDTIHLEQMDARQDGDGNEQFTFIRTTDFMATGQVHHFAGVPIGKVGGHAGGGLPKMF